MTARIVWADGSKQLAHNLDDLYERWQLKRQAMTEIDQRHDIDRFSEMMIPTTKLDNLTVEQALELKEQLMAVKTTLNKNFMRLRTETQVRLPDVIFHLKMAEKRAVEHLEKRAGREIDILNRRISTLKKEHVNTDSERQELYIRFLRGNLYGMLECDIDEQAREMITALLNHQFEVGDARLFGGVSKA